MPESPVFWYASRALGVSAYVALTLEVLLGLSASTGVLDARLGRAAVIELHRWLSALVLASVGAHALVLLGDRAVDLGVLDLLVPFVGPYRPLATGLGVLGAWLLLLVHASFALRRRLGPRFWRALHAVTFPLFALATFHGLLAGSDRGWLGLRLLYLSAVGVVSALIFVRLAAFAWRGAAKVRGVSAR